MKNKIKKPIGKSIAMAYVNIILDEKGTIHYELNYNIDKTRVSLQDIMALQSFLGKLKYMADSDFRTIYERTGSKIEIGTKISKEDKEPEE